MHIFQTKAEDSYIFCRLQAEVRTLRTRLACVASVPASAPPPRPRRFFAPVLCGRKRRMAEWFEFSNFQDIAQKKTKKTTVYFLLHIWRTYLSLRPILNVVLLPVTAVPN